MQRATRSLFRLHSVARQSAAATRCSCKRNTEEKTWLVTSHRLCSTVAAEVIPLAQPEGQEKTYTPKIQKLVDDIGQLTLIEVADLNELLKKTLKIADAPMMAMGAGAAGPAKEEEEDAAPAKQEQVNFTVKLQKFDASKKVALIKEIKNCVPGMNLVQAKKFVESAPQVVKADIPKEEAEKLKEVLSGVGAEISIE